MAGLNKKKLRRELERDRREKQHRRVLELRALISLAVLKRREQRAGIRLQCRTARVKLREQCALRQERAKLEGARAIEERRRELHEERATERLLRSADRRVAVKRSSSKERRQESDDEVRANIARDLVPAFDKYKRQIKGTVRKTRTEAFLQWAEENPGEIYALQNEQADREIAEMVAEHNREARKVHRRPISARKMLADVPF